MASNLINKTKIKYFWNTYFYDLIFISSLLLLILLVSWWAVFIHRSIEEAYSIKQKNIQLSMQACSRILGLSETEPEPGIYSADKRLEIVKNINKLSPDALPLIPEWKEYYLQPRAQHLKIISEKYQRHKLMIFGESTFLTLLIIISGFMIYRMFWLERRLTSELHEFWSRVSHEIKTPITGLRAFLETLQTQSVKKDELLPYIKLALEQVDRQQKLAENMLVGQKLLNRGAGLNETNVHVDSFFQNYLGNHFINLSDTEHTIDYKNTIDKNIYVKADNEALKIICDNIIDNAVKYGSEGNLVLSIGIYEISSHCCIVFRDNGPGIKHGEEKVIFEAYRRLNDGKQNSKQGTGMGLYISRQLARQMNGDLLVRNREDTPGAEFSLELRMWEIVKDA